MFNSVSWWTEEKLEKNSRLMAAIKIHALFLAELPSVLWRKYKQYCIFKPGSFSWENSPSMYQWKYIEVPWILVQELYN